ncbi:MAG: phosphoribosylformylglycinamidine cyclo-ligase, partial [Halanaerobiales bacterium]|nr:phosphoribosylformylglycinamidine cyclo-ligase [Halanaerobiales bacterium]
DIFNDIQKRGKIRKEEMFKTFNMGIGMVLVVNNKIANHIINLLNDLGQEANIIGKIIEGDNKVVLKG